MERMSGMSLAIDGRECWKFFVNSGVRQDTNVLTVLRLKYLFNSIKQGNFVGAPVLSNHFPPSPSRFLVILHLYPIQVFSLLYTITIYT